MLEDRNKKKKYLEEENCQKGLWQRNYLSGQIRNMIRDVRKDLKGTGNDERGDKSKEKEH